MEGGDGTDIVGLSTIFTFVCLDGTEHNLGVLVRTADTFESGLELHAGTTVRSPEIYNDGWVLLDQLGQVQLGLDFADFTKLSFWQLSWLAAATELLHHLPELSRVLAHLPSHAIELSRRHLLCHSYHLLWLHSELLCHLL